MTVKEALATLFSAFPDDRHAQPETIRLYERKLSDIPGPLLETTINKLVDTAKFFPSIAEIRHIAAGLAGLLPAPAEEALAIIRRADVREPVLQRDGSFAYTERYWRFPENLSGPTLKAIEAALERMGDSVTSAGKDIFAWESGFKAVYGAVASDQTALALEDLSQVKLLGRQDALLLPEAQRQLEN